MKKIVLLLLLLPSLLFAQKGSKQRDYFQVTVYHFKNAEQESKLDEYLKNALLPAYHRMKIASVGVFKAMANDTAADKRIYTVIPIKTLEQSYDLNESLMKDADFTKAGAAFLDAPYNQPTFARKEVILLYAFPTAPKLTLPTSLQTPKEDHIYELRSYESASYKLHLNKLKMFNEGGEIPLFDRLNFNSVFYGAVIAGSRMPNLMYMTSFDNMEARDAHWKAFFADPAWKVLAANEEFKNNVSRNEITFLKSASYSDY